MSIVTTTFYGVNANPEMVRLQKAVMDSLGIQHEQILTDLDHPTAIETFLALHRREYYIFMDLDCIALNREVLEVAHKYITTNTGVWGCTQNANHIPNSRNYCGSFCFGFSRDTYERAGKPSMQHDWKVGDVASKLSYAMYDLPDGQCLSYLPTHVEIPKWKLEFGQDFGLGTTYYGGIYHAFESRFDHESAGMFIRKCNEVLAKQKSFEAGC